MRVKIALESVPSILVMVLVMECVSQSLVTTELFRDILPEETRLNFTGFANKFGRNVEEYDVVTDDGYVLKVFRIPSKGEPVLMTHGFANSADSFIIRGNKSLALTLAEDGYDVWVANCRGNRYGRRHLILDPDKDKAFWDFSFHESGMYDLPATIDLVLNVTGKAKINALGHSVGNTIFYVLAALKPEYNEKVNVVIALGPIAYMSRMSPYLTVGMHMVIEFNDIFEELGFNEILGDQTPEKILEELLCVHGTASFKLCADYGIFLVDGRDPEGIDKEFLPVLVSHFPAGYSRRTMLHLAQLRSGKFCQFDFGLEENLRTYKDKNPPEYDLGKVKMKVAMLAGKNDAFCPIRNVKRLKKKLSNVVEYTILEPPKWNHLDWVWSKDIKTYLLPHVLRLLKKYSL